MKNILLISLSVFILNIAIAQSSGFKITGNGTTLYLGGTIHMLKKSDFPLPTQYDSVYKKANVLYFETDVSDMQTKDGQAKMLQDMMYQDGKTLKTELSKKTFASLEKTCKENSLPIALLQKMKPSAAIIALTVIKMMKMGYIENGVDAHFETIAKKDKKPIKYLESVEFQLDLMTNIGGDDEDKFVLNSIKDIDNMEADFEVMKKAWIEGDEKNIQIQAIEMKNEYPEMYKSLLTERNKNWMEKIIPMLSTEEVELILVGALHLYGEDGLLKLLKEQGFEIEQL